MRIPRSLSFILTATALAACNPFDNGGSEGSACAEGWKAARLSDGRTLCVGLSTVAEAPFLQGFYTARVTHRVRLTEADGRPVDLGNDPVITDISHHPMMTMNSGHHHSTPHAHEPEASSDPAEGLYDLTAYYSMPSGPQMGQWSYVVQLFEAGAESPLEVAFQPEVQAVPAPDLFSTRLSNSGDQTQNMAGMAIPRPYTVWLHAVVPQADGGHRLTVFLSTQDMEAMDMEGMTMMHASFPEVVAGETVLHGNDGTSRTVGSVQLQVSIDGGSSWVDLTHEGEGRYGADVTGLTAGERSTVQVSLTVDGLAMTTAAGDPGQLSFLVP